MTYEIVYDERYIAPGFIIYRTDYKQFLKIMPTINDDVNSFTFIASDDVMDDAKVPFRHILFNIDNNSNLYSAFLTFCLDLNGSTCFSTDPKKEGYNQIRVEKLENGIFLQVTKDLTHSLNLDYNAISVTTIGTSIGKLYTNLKKVVKQKDANKVLKKMVNLKPIK